MVDVFEIKVGDTVKFRNGQVHTVVKAKIYERDLEGNRFRRFHEIWIDLHNGRTDFTYGNSNGFYYSTGQSAWDIVEHIPNQAEEEPAVEWNYKWVHKDEEPAQYEMTMRDQFAMSALNGLLSNPQCKAFSFSFDAELVVRHSYGFADKMMKAREE